MIQQELRDERFQEGVHAWRPGFVKRRPLLIVPIVVIPWIIVFALMAAEPSFRPPVISTVILVVYSARLVANTFDRCSR
jgi:hypothetical protein